MKTRLFIAAFVTLSLLPLASFADLIPAPKSRPQSPPAKFVSGEADGTAGRPPLAILIKHRQTRADVLAEGRLFPVVVTGSRIEIGFKTDVSATAGTPLCFAPERPLAVQFHVARVRF